MRILVSCLAIGVLVARLEAQTVSTVITGSFEPLDAQAFEPYGAAVDLLTNAYYFTDSANNSVLKYDTATTNLSVVVDGRMGNGPLSSPSGIVMSQGPGANRLIVADTANHLIRTVDSDSGAVTTIAGSTQGSQDGPGTTAQFNFPAGIALDPSSGTVYVADALNNELRSIDSSHLVKTLAFGFNKEAGVAVGDTTVTTVGGVTQTQQQVWIADTLNQVIWLLTITKVGNAAPTNSLTLVAGQYRLAGSWDAVDASTALFNSPRGLLWLGGQTGLLIADTENNSIRQLSYNASRGAYSVSTFSGAPAPAQPALIDGPIKSARFNSPVGLALDAEGAILVTDLKNNAIRKISRAALPTPGTLNGNVAVSGGSLSNAITLTFTNATAGATFRYTTDGSAPNPLSAAANSITLTGGPNNSVVLRYKAYSPDYVASGIVSNYYTFFVADPIVEPTTATSDNEVTLKITEATADAAVYWTLDGTEPGAGSNRLTLNNGQGTLIVTTNGTVKLKAFRSGFQTSQTVSVPVSLTCGTPDISPAGYTGNNSVNITLSTTTVNASIYWTIDGTEPTPGATLYTGPFPLTSNGTLKAKAFRNGFTSSATTSQNFVLTVADPQIDPAKGAASFEPVTVTFKDATTNALVFWTIDGTDPSTNSHSVLMVNGQGSILLEQNGTLKTRAFRNGFLDSQIVSADFSLSVAPLKVTPVGGLSIDTVTVNVSSSTPGAQLRYTLDGTTPAANSAIYGGSITILTNTILTVVGFRDGFVPSPVVANNYIIQVDTPSMTPQNGYFPSGSQVTFSVLRTNAVIYYTTDGKDPSTNDAVYTGPITVDQVSFPSADLRLIKARAFAPDTLPSAIVSGQSFTTNVVGVPRDMIGSVGATLIMPVVANLASNQVLRSLQFRLEVSPASGQAPATGDMLPLSVSPNDFVPLVVNSDGSYSTYRYSTYRSGATSGLVYASIATNNLHIQNFGVALNVQVPIPGNAHPGDKYKISVVQISGTSDGAQGIVPLSPLPDRVLTITNVPYLVGDSALGRWYNAGEFGDGNLDNADVNNAFLASFGIHVPPTVTDAFSAMDAYPADAPGFVGGDGQIRFLDWSTIMNRSLRRDTHNWMRAHTTTGALTNWTTSLVGAKNTKRAKKNPAVPPGQVWLRQAQIQGDTVTSLLPGSTCKIPVSVNVQPGYSLGGLQFRASIKAGAGAPAITEPITFQSALDSPPTLMTYSNDVLCAWPAPASFIPSLVGSNYLGYVQFDIPGTAKHGDSYTLQFSYCDGAPDLETQYDFESFQTQVWLGAAPETPNSRISDEWRTQFFGSANAVAAADNEDPDGDGATNWQEYLAGTNPTQRQSHLQLSSNLQSLKSGSPVKLEWLSAPNKTYIIESCAAINGNWSPITTVTGDGNALQFTITNKTGQLQFYRLRLQP